MIENYNDNVKVFLLLMNMKIISSITKEENPSIPHNMKKKKQREDEWLYSPILVLSSLKSQSHIGWEIKGKEKNAYK